MADEAIETSVTATEKKPADVEPAVPVKKQPWKEFFEQGDVSTQPAYKVVGEDTIRLRAELDDKDLGG